MDVTKPKITISINENGIFCGKMNLNNTPARIELQMPPMNPTKLLFGLAATQPLVDFPNKTPKNHASESQIKTKIKNKLIKYVEFSITVSLERNVSKKPQ